MRSDCSKDFRIQVFYKLLRPLILDFKSCILGGTWWINTVDECVSNSSFTLSYLCGSGSRIVTTAALFDVRRPCSRRRFEAQDITENFWAYVCTLGLNFRLRLFSRKRHGFCVSQPFSWTYYCYSMLRGCAGASAALNTTVCAAAVIKVVRS